MVFGTCGGSRSPSPSSTPGSTVEEQIYRRQVYKEALARMVIQRQNVRKYNNRDELRDLFTLTNPKCVLHRVPCQSRAHLWSCCLLPAPSP